MSIVLSVMVQVYSFATNAKTSRYVLLFCCAWSACLPNATAADNTWVRVGASGRLKYTMDARGDRIMDFSGVGYQGGGVPLPDFNDVVPTDRIVNVSALAGDNLANIQNAINTVQSFPLNQKGFRGVVQLAPGSYDLSSSLNITQSGVILRGTGDSSNASNSSILRYTGTSQISLIKAGLDTSLNIQSSSSRNIIDKVVPAGASSMTLDSTAGLSIGDKIVIHRPATQEWIDFLGMDDLGPKSDVVPWSPNEDRYHQYYERTITYIDQTQGRVFLDNPIAHSLELRFGTSTLSHYTYNRIQNVGIESIRGDGQKTLTTPTDEAHGYEFIDFRAVEDGWVRDITAEHWVHSAVILKHDSKNITVTDANSVEPISQITGARRYAFNIEGQLSLMQDLLSDKGRHDFVNNNPSRGPNVFLDAVATNSYSDSGPHQRYSTGTLYDNIQTNTALNVENRYDSGTGHGWSGANMVYWNSQASSFRNQNPYGAQNWLIGSTGSFVSRPPYPDGYRSAHGDEQTLLGETSLYRAQLNQKLANPNEISREYWIGDFDQFEVDPSDSQLPVDPAWASALQSAYPSTPQIGMDVSTTGTRVVPFTFGFDVPSGNPSSALLTIALDTSGSIANTSILLDGIANQIPLSSLSFLPTFEGSRIVMLEILPGAGMGGLTTLLDGTLNVAVIGTQKVDWADLQFTFNSTLTGIAGDVDLDGDLDQDDLDQFISAWLSVTNGLNEADKIRHGDLNLDGLTNLHDAYLMRLAFKTNPDSSGSISSLNQLFVPEPATWVIAIGSLVGMLFLQRNRNSRKKPSYESLATDC